MPRFSYDSYQVHRAALARGLTVLALPRQVLLAGPGAAVPAAVSFTHGVPEASTVSAVTHAQDRRLRRALLERNGLPVPKGATFTYGSVDSAIRWAAALGWPVVAKDAMGENPATMIAGISTGEALREAFRTLRIRRPEDRAPGRNPELAGYAATRLGFDIDEDGNQVAPPRTRFLVEKQLTGEYLRVFTCGDAAPISITLVRSTATGVDDVTGSIDPSLRRLAVRAVRCIPGLAAGTVDLIVDDHRKPADEQSAHIVEVAERPRADSFATVSPAHGDRIGDYLLEYQAACANVTLADPNESISATFRIEGLQNPEASAHGYRAVAHAYGVDGDAAVVNRLEGILDGECSGTPAAIAALHEAMMSGAASDDRASCIECRVGA
ncbi:hypothetical protein [Phytoactinopolyspora halotolerans]|uniref:ATP-grasp domain-containing protein n=1 Tax=Phytoactinopolyspora halotolerans TaxID=1981512 RepID=A0A6L9SG95_9ACTN|nr:hypothetical protein [Phytoactinopolyspora halotolerans]NEE04097.1 hypothetical protein [Phytoactinopolyspora halotolerans]